VRGGEQCAAERGEHRVNVYYSTGHELAFYREQGGEERSARLFNGHHTHQLPENNEGGRNGSIDDP
jgi:hypothetical protein